VSNNSRSRKLYLYKIPDLAMKSPFSKSLVANEHYWCTVAKPSFISVAKCDRHSPSVTTGWAVNSIRYWRIVKYLSQIVANSHPEVASFKNCSFVTNFSANFRTSTACSRVTEGNFQEIRPEFQFQANRIGNVPAPLSN
jgi:hypothetical protein